MSEGKSVAREINELLDLERAMLAAKPLGQEPPVVEQVAYYEKKRDLFRRIAATARGEYNRMDETTATESAEAAEKELERLRAKEPEQ